MSIELVQTRLNSYQCQNAQEEENALKEITQEIALLSLSQSGFFKHAAFLGGTCLRIFYGLQRFSEDLDFSLVVPDERFALTPYLKKLERDLQIYGYQIEIQDRSSTTSAVRNALLKDESCGKVLTLKFPSLAARPKKLRIKLEVDTRPPPGALCENSYHIFPIPMVVTVHTLPSLFSGKLHALLCRPYIKGRDWYDLLWYLKQRIPCNPTLLSNALKQTGPWQSQEMVIDSLWLQTELGKKIRSLDWIKVRADVAPFLKPMEQSSLTIWSEQLFLSQLPSLKVDINSSANRR